MLYLSPKKYKIKKICIKKIYFLIFVVKKKLKLLREL